MKRFGSLFVLLLVFGVFAGGAQAKQVESQRVAQSPEEVAAYWTNERMRNAKPVDRKPRENAKGGGGGGKKPAAGSATEVPAPYTTFPTATNGKVFFTDNGLNYVCSGTALAGLTGRVVWTAGHCVNEGPGDYFTNWAFVPAYRDGGRPYGTWSATSLHTTSAWASSGDFSYDLGAARVAEPNTTATLTATIGGGRTPAFNYDRDQRYNAYGYPAASPFNGQRLWKCDSSLYMNDTNRSPQTMGIQCNMTGGSSGGGWVVPTDNRVYSVNSYGYSSLRNVMFGPFQGDVAEELYTTADRPPAS